VAGNLADGSSNPDFLGASQLGGEPNLLDITLLRHMSDIMARSACDQGVIISGQYASTWYL
jgi:hypothetical protein